MAQIVFSRCTSNFCKLHYVNLKQSTIPRLVPLPTKAFQEYVHNYYILNQANNKVKRKKNKTSQSEREPATEK